MTPSSSSWRWLPRRRSRGVGRCSRRTARAAMGTRAGEMGRPRRSSSLPPRTSPAGTSKASESTPSGCAPTDDDLFRRLTLGVPGTDDAPFTSMPGPPTAGRWWPSSRSSTARAQCKVISPPSPIPPPDPDRGKALYAKLGCVACHGAQGQGGAVKDRADALGQPVWASDLTQPAALRGGPRAADIYLRITSGIDGTAMPSYADNATDEERWQLSQYLVSIQDPDRHEALEPRGRRLLLALGCAFCHSGVDAAGNYDPLLSRFGGGQVVEVRPLAAYAPGNLHPGRPRGLVRCRADRGHHQRRSAGAKARSGWRRPGPHFYHAAAPTMSAPWWRHCACFRAWRAAPFTRCSRASASG